MLLNGLLPGFSTKLHGGFSQTCLKQNEIHRGILQNLIKINYSTNNYTFQKQTTNYFTNLARKTLNTLSAYIRVNLCMN